MEQAVGGRKAIKTLFGLYDEVLAFDHPTLSVCPVMNAFDIARLLAKADGPLDIIAHSRGGVVTRWLLEGFGLNGTGPYRAMLVGSPLAGTSLASPPRLKGTLDVLSNFGTALNLAGGMAVTYMPFLIVPLALVRVASSVVSVASKTPLVDAAVSMIPGLQGQSRIANHPELMRLRAVKLAKPPRYFVVQSNHETEDPGWKFWRYFRKDKLADIGADLIFDGPNDLVVDTVSMGDVGRSLPKDDIHDFKTNPRVHHTNYSSRSRRWSSSSTNSPRSAAPARGLDQQPAAVNANLRVKHSGPTVRAYRGHGEHAQRHPHRGRAGAAGAQILRRARVTGELRNNAPLLSCAGSSMVRPSEPPSAPTRITS